jgi:fluoroquinolone transport system permease protein
MGYILSPMISGMVIAFIFLDEKDDNVWSVLRIMPVDKNKFVLMRFIFPVTLSFVCVFPIPWVIDVFEIPWYVNLTLSIMGGLQSVILALIICLKAKNKVEGFAMVKMLGMLMMLPVFSIMINSNWEYLFAIIPTYWSYKPLIGLVMQETWVNWVLSLGFLIHIALTILLIRLFLKQMANE